MNRRTALGVLASGAITGLAGCSEFGSGTATVEDERTIDPGDPDRSASEFQEFIADVRDVYGPGGVWGRARTEPDHELPFQGAWTTSPDHTDGANSSHVLALYQLPPGPEGERASQVWLWSGVEPAAGDRVGAIRTTIELPEGASLGIYSPAQDVHANRTDRYTIESGRLDAATLAAEIPLERGSIGVGEGTRVGDGGAFAPFWAGESGAATSLAATTEVRWTDDDRNLTWSLAVESTA